MRPLSADVVIIGSDMGGGTTAHALARRGIDVFMLRSRSPRQALRVATESDLAA